MQNLKQLDDILLSQKVVEEFRKAMQNTDFANWIVSVVPEIIDCANLNQDNPWHIYNCLNHILHSVDEMNKQTEGLDLKERRLLAYTMFYHDIGKPAVHIRRYSKLYKREVDSFFNHNIKSAEIVRKSADKFGFSEEEINLIEKLVLEHDMFMFITEDDDLNPYHKVLSEKLIKDIIDELSQFGDGKKHMLYLIMIGRADNKAQNPDMTENSLRLLDKMEKMTKDIEPAESDKQL